MSELQRFLPADQELLVGLFYRVGQWMSNIDDTDTSDKSEQEEESQIIKILTQLSQSKHIGSLCSEIATESLRQKGSWVRWAKNWDSVLDDVSRAKIAVIGQATDEEYKLFGKSLMTVATAVARAYREAEDADMQNRGFMSWISEKKSHAVLAIFDPEVHKDLNISPAEDEALTQLANMLKV